MVGTVENEVLAVNFLKKRISAIQQKAHESQNVTLDHQIVSGSYFLPFKPSGMFNIYRKIQNVVVRLDGDSPNALMVNCHFDSMPGSPGAADDGANCAIMLELISILSTRTSRNRHSVIFLFNGAEEVALRASHGFITQHRWAKDVKAFINLEAAGSGGKETLFQTGPGNSWLLDHYKAVRRPFAQAVGEEIFQSGVIPSDTDFRIFRDFGDVPGMDFAHASKGYRYHTKFDSIDYLTQGVLQRTGENMLSLVLSLVNGFELDDVTVSWFMMVDGWMWKLKTSQEDFGRFFLLDLFDNKEKKFWSIKNILPTVRLLLTLQQSLMMEIFIFLSSQKFSKSSSAVYFDYLGFFFIHYSKEVGVVVNFAVVILSIAVPFLTLTKATTNVHSKHILSETLLGFLAIVFGSGFSGLVCYITAYSLDRTDHSMSWFRNPSLAAGIYGTVALLAQILVYDLVELTLASKKSPISLGLKVQARLNGVNIFWGIVTLGITVLGFRSGYIFMVILLVNLMANIAIYFMGLHNSGKFKIICRQRSPACRLK